MDRFSGKVIFFFDQRNVRQENQSLDKSFRDFGRNKKLSSIFRSKNSVGSISLQLGLQKQRQPFENDPMRLKFEEAKMTSTSLILMLERYLYCFPEDAKPSIPQSLKTQLHHSWEDITLGAQYTHRKWQSMENEEADIRQSILKDNRMAETDRRSSADPDKSKDLLHSPARSSSGRLSRLTGIVESDESNDNSSVVNEKRMERRKNRLASANSSSRSGGFKKI